jgi:hypothetical protein
VKLEVLLLTEVSEPLVMWVFKSPTEVVCTAGDGSSPFPDRHLDAA